MEKVRPFTPIRLKGKDANLLIASVRMYGRPYSRRFHRIVHDPQSGELSYDADGDGPIAAIQFARLDAGLALTHQDMILAHDRRGLAVLQLNFSYFITEKLREWPVTGQLPLPSSSRNLSGLRQQPSKYFQPNAPLSQVSFFPRAPWSLPLRVPALIIRMSSGVNDGMMSPPTA